MNRLSSPVMTRAAVLLLALVGLVGQAVAQPKALKDQLVGTWTFVSSTGQRDDGSATWGPNSKGLLILAENGRFSLQIMRTDRPKYSSNTRSKGSLIENQATSRGTISYFGKYDVNDTAHTLTYHIEHSSFPNLNGVDQARTFTLENDLLKYVGSGRVRRGSTTQFIWKRE